MQATTRRAGCPGLAGAHDMLEHYLTATTRWLRLVLLTLGCLAAGAQEQPESGKPTTGSESTTSKINATAPATAASQGPLAQWRQELDRLGSANTPAAEREISAWLDRLLGGKVAKELQLEVLEAAGKHSTPVIEEKLARYQTVRLEEGGLATCSELLYGGNAERGKKIFFEKKEAVCIKCHKVGSEGGETGPPLAGTTNLSREYILESILQPNAKITPGYETVAVKLKDRSAYSGIVKRESDSELTLLCPPDEEFFKDRLVTIPKADIASRRKAGSPMPDGLDKTLSPRDLRDLIDFVASLKQEDTRREASITPTPGQQSGESVRATR
jgi:quinoprotein glucose dehydrogenase